MADARSVVELVFQGIDQTGEATQAALRNVSAFGTSIQSAAQPIAEFTTSAIQLEAALLAAGAAITTVSLQAAGDFDAAFREITTLIDAPAESLDAFRADIIAYASDSTASFEQVNAAIYSAISAGVDYQNSLDIVRQAEQLAVAGRGDLSDSLVVLVSSLNAYGESADSAQQYSDALFQTVRLGQTTLPELSQYLSQVTGSAAALQVPFETVLAAIATLTATGTPTAQAVTQINAALTALLKPSADAQRTAAELGIEFDAQAVKAQGLDGVLRNVAEATGGNETQMAKLFGSAEALRAVFPLTGAAAESFASNLSSLANSAGATEQAYEKMAGSFTNANQSIANAVTGLLIEIGTPMLDEWGSVADGIVAIFSALGANVRDGALGDLVQYVEQLLGDLGESLLSFAANLPAALEGADLSGFRQNIEAVVQGVTQLFSGIDLGTPDGVRAVIEALGNAFGTLGTFVGSAVGALETVATAIFNLAQLLEGVDGDFVALAGTIGGLAIILAPLAGAFTAVVAAMLTAGPAITSLVGWFTAASTATSALAATLAPTAGIAIGLYSLSQTIPQITTALGQWYDATVKAREAQEGLAEIQGRTSAALLKVSQDLGITVTSMEQFNALADSGAIEFDAAAGRWVAASGAIRDTTVELIGTLDDGSEASGALASALGDTFSAAGYEFDPLTGAIRQVSDATRQASDAATAAKDSTRGYIIEIIDGVPTFTQFGAAAGGAFSEAQQAAEDALQASESYRLKMEELASNERIANIEAKVALDTAQLEADTRRVEAAFESINTTIQSTGELIGSLFGNLTEATGLDRLEIIDQIEAENERREEALTLQNELTRAQIDALNAKTDALERGDALIQIDGAGLQPHLEAFMWEILRTIQVRVNEDGLEMLLGAA